MEHTRIDATPRKRFMQAVSDELTKFERCEAELRKSERQERAAELHLPLDRAPTSYEPTPRSRHAGRSNQRRA